MAYQVHVGEPAQSATGKTTQRIVRVIDTTSGAVRTYAIDVRHVAAIAAALAKLNGSA